MNSFAFYIIVLLVFDTVGVISAKFWSINKNPLFLFLTMVFFALAGFSFAYSMKFKGLAIANIFWTSLAVIITTVVSYFLFKEEITIIQFIGIAVIIVGLTLVSLK